MKPALIEGVHFHAALPISWQQKSGQSSLELVRYLEVLSELEQLRDDEAGQHTQIHAKLDLALLWLARVLARDMPAEHEAVIGLEQVSWLNAERLDGESPGFVAINLSASLPFLLHLPACVESCIGDDAQGWQITARLQITHDAVRDAWEQTVFRHHRLAIQQQRSRRE